MTDPMRRAERSFRHAVRRHALFAAGDRVLAAVSGGADSVALLRLLHDLAPVLRLEIVAGHVHHAMREAADADQRFVADLASTLGLDFLTLRADPVPRSEEQARRARHRLLRSMADDAGCNRIALAHTMDDQAETMLMRLIRGAGRRGLSGMAREGPGLLVRPLLDVRRSDLRDYLDEMRQPFREDETNQDQRKLRNKVRARLLPLLSEMNRAVVPSLARAAWLLAEEDRLLDRLASEWAAGRAGPEAPGSVPDSVQVEAAALGGLDPALARRAARILLKRAGCDPRGLPAAAVERLLDAARLTGAQELHLDLPGGMKIDRLGLNLVVHRAARQPRRDDAPVAARLSVPGRTDLPELGLSLEARVEPRDAADPLRAGARRAILDADRLGPDLQVRTRLAGDRFHPLGAPGEKKLADVLIDRKIPRAGRDRLLLLIGPQGIAWVVGVAVGHPYRVTEATRRVAILVARGLHPGP